ncbi:MAG: ATP-binding protein [Burkholderiales bacterium]|nr:ATP-binding protein [Burkholderiales bacterium]
MLEGFDNTPQKVSGSEQRPAADWHMITRDGTFRLGLKGSTRSEVTFAIERSVERAITAARYISEDTRRFYFGKLSGFRSAGVVETGISSESNKQDNRSRIEIIDLPSIPQIQTRLLAISACIEAEWEASRAAWDLALAKGPNEDFRVPTFVVVDEAHNVVPRDTRSQAEAAIREQFRTIIAEGRKYGLFLILVSQRPDKLDPLVVSECENRAVMKLSSKSSMIATREMLALEDIPEGDLMKCLELPLGRVLMVGGWAPDGPDFMYAASRRTMEGGRNLRKDYWATPPDPPQNKPKKDAPSSVKEEPAEPVLTGESQPETKAGGKEASPQKDAEVKEE